VRSGGTGAGGEAIVGTSARQPLVLNLAFDSDLFAVLRAEVRAHAGQAGLPEARAEDVVLAVHELAANAVHHGAGSGRLRMWTLAGALHCQVDDGDPRVPEDPAELRVSWCEPGHGLWVVRRLADRMRILSGAHGTRATVTFDLPGRRGQDGLQA
jgi:anti-sigma regulatory factor (Ser/Thr protein kinase)